jgi:predicted nucleic acid-binding protein
MIVPDASYLVSALGEDGEPMHDRLVPLWQSTDVYAPELIDLEVTSVVRRAVRLGRMDPERAIQLLADLALMPFKRVSHVPFLNRIWELRDNLSPYDASYVAIAEIMGATLVTADARLARALGIRCEVQVLA